MLSKKFRLFIFFFVCCGIIVLNLIDILKPGWKSYFRKVEYEGRVKLKFYDPEGKGLPTIKVEGSDENYILLKDHIFENIKTGDYIIKRKGTTKHILIRNGDTTFFDPVFEVE